MNKIIINIVVTLMLLIPFNLMANELNQLVNSGLEREKVMKKLVDEEFMDSFGKYKLFRDDYREKMFLVTLIRDELLTQEKEVGELLKLDVIDINPISMTDVENIIFNFYVPMQGLHEKLKSTLKKYDAIKSEFSLLFEEYTKYKNDKLINFKFIYDTLECTNCMNEEAELTESTIEELKKDLIMLEKNFESLENDFKFWLKSIIFWEKFGQDLVQKINDSTGNAFSI